MELIRDFFEKVFLSEFIINEQSLLHVPQLRELLELKVHDFVSINDTIIQVSIVVDQDVVINDALLNSLVVHLNTQYDSYSVKYKKLYSS